MRCFAVGFGDMLFNLNDIETGKTVEKECHFPTSAIEAVAGPVQLRAVRATLRFRRDPLGFVVHYRIHANAGLACVRCGGTFWQDVTSEDWVSLRQQHPQGDHVILADAEMNVRFITSLSFDIARFVEENLELDLPAYPRHREDDPACLASGPRVDPHRRATSSPFAVLSKYLDTK